MIRKRDKATGTRFEAALLLLEKSIRHLDAVGVNKAAIADCKKLMSFLRSMSDGDIESTLQASHQDQRKPKVTEISDAELEALTPQQIRDFSNDASLSRVTLERLAEKRFGVTKGALSNLRNREALREKLLTLAHHEDTHEAISRAAASKDKESKDY